MAVYTGKTNWALNDTVMPADLNRIESGIVASQNAETAKKFAASKTIDGVSFDGSSNVVHYGSCSTAANVAEKAVNVANATLVTGLQVAVKFNYANTAANPTLNVNYTGGKPIYRGGAPITSGTFVVNTVYTFVYTGSFYELITAVYAGDADMVDGQHVILADAAGLKPIQFSTTDLTAGTSTLTTGHVYIVYE